MTEQRIGKIGTCYGGLVIKQEGEKYCWGIEYWDGVYWEEIPESLYTELVKFREKQD